MFAIDTTPGRFDLAWRMFGTPIRIKPSFWIFQLIFGWSLKDRPALLLIWVACSFFAILVHELGHVLAGRWFGFPGSIVIYGMGGGAIGEYGRATRPQRMAIAAAGPIAGLSIYAALFFLTPWFVGSVFPQIGRAWAEYVIFGFGFLVFMSLFWNLLNLPPVIPLDGGMILQAALPQRNAGQRLAYAISFATALGLVAWGILKIYRPTIPYVESLFRFLFPADMRSFLFSPDPLFSAIIFGMLAFQSFQTLMRIGPSVRRPTYE